MTVSENELLSNQKRLVKELRILKEEEEGGDFGLAVSSVAACFLGALGFMCNGPDLDKETDLCSGTQFIATISALACLYYLCKKCKLAQHVTHLEAQIAQEQQALIECYNETLQREQPTLAEDQRGNLARTMEKKRSDAIFEMELKPEQRAERNRQKLAKENGEMLYGSNSLVLGCDDIVYTSRVHVIEEQEVADEKEITRLENEHTGARYKFFVPNNYSLNNSDSPLRNIKNKETEEEDLAPSYYALPVSRPAELPLWPLAEPYLTLSCYTAPIKWTQL